MIRTLTEKVIEGIRSQSWEIIGRGGTWAGAMRPLEIYIQRKVERAVKAEREACAVTGGAAAMAGQNYIGVAAAIRARGEK